MPTLVQLQRARHGSGFRAIGLRGAAALIDPFIGVDHAWMSAPTFAPHPHAGLAAVSYVFPDSETGLANRDSLGSHNLIEPGGVHWLVAGSGAVHEEVPAKAGKTVHSLQIFVQLPPDQRSAPPQAISLRPQQVATVLRPGVQVRVAAGEFAAHRSPADAPTAVDMLDIRLEAGAELSIPVAAGRTAFVLPVSGTVQVDGQAFGLDDLQVPVYPAGPAAQVIRLHAAGGAANVMLFIGTPFHPVSL
jgi:redox-sensitive bicupin YhaK (pirin superfamily)